MTVASSVRYERPTSMAEAVAVLSGGDAVVLAGGTDLVLMRAAGISKSKVVMDIKRIPTLADVAPVDGGVSIGSAVTAATLARMRACGLGAIADGASVIGGLQTRNRATVGGNIWRASPAGDLLPPLLAHSARLTLISAAGQREIPLAQFMIGPGQHVGCVTEMVSRIQVESGVAGSAYQRFTYRNWMDLAVVSVACRVALREDGVCEHATIAAGAVAPTPVVLDDAAEVLRGSQLEQSVIEEACEHIACAIAPVTDTRATRAFRMRVVRVQARGAILAARDRALRGAQPGYDG